MPEFRIQIERLTEVPQAFEFEASPAWWRAREPEGDASEVTAETPFRFSLSAARPGTNVVIEGNFEGEVGLECSRCAKRYPHALREPYRLVLERLSSANADRPGGEEAALARGASRPQTELDPEAERGLAENGVCLGEDLEAGLYRGAVVGLDDFFGEVIALAMPIQPLCSEDCPGICTHCGAAPDAGCDCEDAKIESPFAVLAKLKRSEEN